MASMASSSTFFPSFIFLVLCLTVTAKRTYIVHMKHQDKPLSFETHYDWYSSSLQSLSATPAESLLYSYNTAFNGFAASLDPEQAEALSKSDSVLGVYEDTVYNLHTTRTPQFLGLDSEFGLWEGHNTQQLEQASRDVIIGVLDTGVWPESKSFDDSGLPEIPSKWRGECESAPDFNRKLCNKKLIGARSFSKGYHMAAGNKVRYNGVSLYSGQGMGKNPVGLVYSKDSSSSNLCLTGSLDPALVRGKVVICDRGTNARVEKGAVVRDAGGVGMILANTEVSGEELVADSHLLPAVAVGRKVGDLIREYARSDPNPTATLVFGGTVLDVKPSPVVAAFSSRGPNMVTPQILKPDVIGPGVNILAGWSEAIGPTGLAKDTRKTQFNIMSGTSMSCPHISGLAALIKAAHPEWSPSAIKSALMTTAYTQDNTNSSLRDAADGSLSNPWAHGAGHVDPQRALSPGLVYDISTEEYITFLCSLGYTIDHVKTIVKRPNITCSRNFKDPGELNYPSFSVLFGDKRVVRYTRELTNVGPAMSVYSVAVKGPSTVGISVRPRTLTFRTVGEKKRYTVTFVAKRGTSPMAKPEFGSIVWGNARSQVKSPVSFTWTELSD
ncbi:hypothetical protein V6N12_015732 [Hibiscus sabdariffa]|uniref:Subtilisin-like protease n=1 Tax=Hibiscus sabdariffa TaxID=183260 RepID=A0ABR2DNZ9_9ROSI